MTKTTLAYRVRLARKEKNMTMTDMVDKLNEKGYPISYVSYANFETDQSGALHMNKQLFKKIMEVLELRYYTAILLTGEWAEMPEKPLRSGPHKNLARPRKALGDISKALASLHHEDPENMGFCEGCEMFWPCSTEVKIISKLLL